MQGEGRGGFGKLITDSTPQKDNYICWLKTNAASSSQTAEIKMNNLRIQSSQGLTNYYSQKKIMFLSLHAEYQMASHYLKSLIMWNDSDKHFCCGHVVSVII